MTNLVLLVLMFCGGIAIAVQPSINARLAQKVGALESSCISFAVGTLVLIAVVLSAGKGNLRAAAGTNWWEWTGGAFGAFFVTMTIFVVPRVGTAAAMSVVIAAQLTTGVLLDHYGAFGLRHVPFDLKRLLGCLFLFAGATLIARR
ncbi:membrane protein [Geomonas silvestris]|uniref:Membrane protein n=1 Tax=Geomonas silvestris TaxID=2740184 RepID=A0A6V8MJI1_9BACT|nr:DMT family transporter [Geomonas silvestris]GFO60128.1 membrane protein [Geomonas silvestris]